MLKNPQFKITFIDNTIFEGNSLSSDWTNIPNKPIVSLKFSIGKLNVVLENYQEYNHLKERILTRQQNQISQILIMGRKESETDIFIFDLRKNKVKKETVEKGFEYGNWEDTEKIIDYNEWNVPIMAKEFHPQILSGWKLGILDKDPIFRYE